MTDKVQNIIKQERSTYTLMPSFPKLHLMQNTNNTIEYKLKKEKPSDYIRIGEDFYKIQEKLDPVHNETKRKYKTWTYATLKRDHSKEFIMQIEMYDDFIFMPQHINYEQVIGNYYNAYLPLAYRPAQGEFPITKKFLTHIFQEQFELGLDYLQLLYLKPLQKLPILALVSKEQSTGKSTFLEYLHKIFSDNMILITNESFSSNFNKEWLGKLLLGIEETFLTTHKHGEKLKSISTSKYILESLKYLDREEGSFFGKFILCSNNETNFARITPEETRFWVRKLPTIKEQDTQMLEKLVDEIPAFLNFLSNRELSTQNKDRLWFSPDEIRTEALLKVMRNYGNMIEYELYHTLRMLMDFEEKNTICLIPEDAYQWLQGKGLKDLNINKIREILKQDWKLEPRSNSCKYDSYRLDSMGNPIKSSKKGRYYEVAMEDLSELYNLI
jgi:hypothetical protein